ncbi:MAG: hypothetical protein ACMG57_04615 [Candidatus Dojkabacteria bacterium]
MKNIRTISLLVIAIVVVVTAVVLSGVTEINVSDAFAAARVVRDPETPTTHFTPKVAPSPKPEPRKEVQVQKPAVHTVTSGTASPTTTKPATTRGTVTATPRTGPTTTTPNTNRVTSTTPPVRTVGTTNNTVTQRSDNSSGNAVRNQPSTPPVQAKPSPFKVNCPDNFIPQQGTCVSKCNTNTIFANGGCGLPSCLNGFVINKVTKLCEQPAPITCPAPLVLKGDRCVETSDQTPASKCVSTNATSPNAKSCCTGILGTDGKCTTHNPPVAQPVQSPGQKKPGCPLEYLWCKAGDVFNGGNSGQLKCANVFISDLCGVIKTLVPQSI